MNPTLDERSDPPQAAVVHKPAQQRFELALPEGLAYASYRRQGEVMLLTYTEVPPAAEGRGIAARLVAAALDHAREQGYQVRPLCSYVAAYMRRHPHTHDLLAPR